ncbi:hypothetical protein BCR34DRAFT_551863 [Clohesyomyces aquaticus]|uniref:Uncharacterized protein n=1 Tax=Clohesyomyces aquaticus TaxID=1231657 RepID=A0A1Y2ABI8_9PLEO|nr:hypothetical protein BCR34DRAFT_551863 [Clohesyomyces aquaticus]
MEKHFAHGDSTQKRTRRTYYNTSNPTQLTHVYGMLLDHPPSQPRTENKMHLFITPESQESRPLLHSTHAC